VLADPSPPRRIIPLRIDPRHFTERDIVPRMAQTLPSRVQCAGICAHRTESGHRPAVGMGAITGNGGICAKPREPSVRYKVLDARASVGLEVVGVRDRRIKANLLMEQAPKLQGIRETKGRTGCIPDALGAQPSGGAPCCSEFWP